MALTKRQITKAYRLYSLAVVANRDLSRTENEDEDAVAQAAIDKARTDLERRTTQQSRRFAQFRCFRVAKHRVTAVQS